MNNQKKKDNEINRDEFLEQLFLSFDDSCYPQEFKERFVLLECLSEREGIDTFVVQDQEGTRYIAKCYDKRRWELGENGGILERLKEEGAGIPLFLDSFSNEQMVVTVREYIEGIPLDRFAAEYDLTAEQIIEICKQLCDILAFLHHREEPVIHRDIKPQNVIVRCSTDDLETAEQGNADRPAGEGRRFEGPLSVVLIDFDIARVYRKGSDTDTRFFGTMAYAPPEQYGFSQTDARADIYALGILLRYLLTGSTRNNPNVRVYRPLSKIIEKCTAFSPEERYRDVDQVKKALLQANPKSQRIRAAVITLCCILAAALLTFGGVLIYRAVTWTPFSAEAIPAYESDSERVADAIRYLNEKYHTDLFSGSSEALNGEDADSVATIGYLKRVLTEVYGLDAAYVNAPNSEMPMESEAFFFPWSWDNSQTVDRDIMTYVAVKVYDPKRVADWSSLKEDTGEYPGVRVALAFAEETGIQTGVNRPGDITVGEVALILANTDRVYTAAQTAG